MKRSLLAVAVLSLAVALPAPAHASPPEARSSAKSCPTPQGFMVGPFFADQLRARNTTCSFARVQAKRWGRTRDCVAPRSPSDNVCRVRRWRCVYRDIQNFEGGHTTCRTAGKRKAVGFRFGS